ncbi:uncharacterized protein LOC119595286 [Penaeus monodon]|uniref:uncharacterized protein LOC119595286 n=1 Tax=Penaeus monodon TaxID=6687 RepID=UPI0018A75C48|nr:uncharacterized protein LOC119595286 [Penaeus monodon]
MALGRACLTLLLLLLAATPRSVVAELSQTVGCGSYQLAPGHILTIKGSSQPCAWTFTGPKDSKVEAACSDVSIPRTRRCNNAALMVSTPRSNTARMCGRRSFLTIKRNSDSMTISSAPQGRTKNVFSCDVFLRMPRNARYDCQCGIEYPARIIGGSTPAVNQYPWIANLRYSNMKKVICGAVVVSDSHVITAAHCMNGLVVKRLRVTVAEHNLKTTGRETTEIARLPPPIQSLSAPFPQGPKDSKVEAACSDVSIPKTRRCNNAALMVSTPRSNTARMCGRRSFLTIKRNSDSMTISSAPQGRTKNVFSCDVFLRMPRNARYDCQCGIEYPARIIGGSTPAVNQYPWIANLRYSNMKKVICGAVVVSDSHVITAAHCMNG